MILKDVQKPDTRMSYLLKTSHGIYPAQPERTWLGYPREGRMLAGYMLSRNLLQDGEKSPIRSAINFFILIGITIAASLVGIIVFATLCTDIQASEKGGRE
ncbi:Uncharacterized protein APZ42_031525 [Daphnia magna]|uniref:Uncharacterized protein n=1 Tax=Daphnia magna TaxID=35525 RepID=A0A162DBB8_9CRUS|nr:Uncharacterized protein APZ42_031525 [Daphnia magna]